LKESPGTEWLARIEAKAHSSHLRVAWPVRGSCLQKPWMQETCPDAEQGQDPGSTSPIVPLLSVPSRKWVEESAANRIASPQIGDPLSKHIRIAHISHSSGAGRASERIQVQVVGRAKNDKNRGNKSRPGFACLPTSVKTTAACSAIIRHLGAERCISCQTDPVSLHQLSSSWLLRSGPRISSGPQCQWGMLWNHDSVK